MKVFALLAAALTLQACANPMSIYRPLDTASGTGALIDIKQRAIVAGQRPDPATGTTTTVVCTEPSPDALASYAAELAAQSDKAGAELGAAVREGAAFVGLRTSSIQLLRDQLFYSCLSFMNGAIDKLQYELMSRRYQRQVVALMAIEQLTGAIKAPAVTLSSDNVATASRAAQQLSKDIATTDEALKQLKNELKDKPDNEKPPLQDEIDRLTKNRAAMVQGLANTRDVMAGGRITVDVSNLVLPTQRSDSHVLAVAGTVREIVKNITGVNDLPALCFSALTAAASGTPTPIHEYCETYLKTTASDVEMRLQASLRLQAIADDPSKPLAERERAAKEAERLRSENRRAMDIQTAPGTGNAPRL